jgi:hypothetical protein
MGDLSQFAYDTLVSRPCISIDFTYTFGTGTVRLTQKDFWALAQAIKDKRVGIYPGLVTPGAGAEWNHSSNAIVVDRALTNFGDTIDDEILLVHEAVHGILDMQKIANLWWVHEECMAYIAGALYGLHAGANFDGIPNPGFAVSAVKIAKKLKNQPGAHPDYQLVADMYELLDSFRSSNVYGPRVKGSPMEWAKFYDHDGI